MSTDPKSQNYPGNSPYSFAINSPILFIDNEGKEVYAYDTKSQELLLKVLTYAFGDDHGFSFENNKLVHNGKVPEKLNSEQTIVFNYFNEVLVKSQYRTEIYVDKSIYYAGYNKDGEEIIGVQAPDGGATTINININETTYTTTPHVMKGASTEYGIVLKDYIYTYDGKSEPPRNVILIPGSVLDGIELTTGKGNTKFPAEHAVLHELGHAIMNTILVSSEFKGLFNGQDFKTLTPEQQDDFSIRITNTLNKGIGKPIETGEGQHGRDPSQKPTEDPKPLEK